MIFKMISPLLVFSLLHASTSVLEIVTFQREGNTVQLQCREEQFNGQPPTELHNVSLLLFNSTGQSVTSLLVENNIDYDFDSRGILSFEVQQDIEGYYYCSRDKSAGLPDDEDDYETILAHPSRVNVPTEYIIQVGEPVTLVNGVGEGALAEHYSATWFKDGLPLADANVSRGKDFSLHIEAVEFMDAGEYLSSVTIQNDNGAEYTVLENDHPIQLTVYGKFLDAL
jgi:hypothetical protein